MENIGEEIVLVQVTMIKVLFKKMVVGMEKRKN